MAIRNNDVWKFRPAQRDREKKVALFASLYCTSPHISSIAPVSSQPTSDASHSSRYFILYRKGTRREKGGGRRDKGESRREGGDVCRLTSSSGLDANGGRWT